MQKNIALLVYYDCFDMLENALGGDDASFAWAVRALVRYARTGEVPQALERTHPMAFFAFRMLQPKVDATLASAEDTSGKRAEAAKRRWSSSAQEKTENSVKTETEPPRRRAQSDMQNMQTDANDANDASYPIQADPIQSEPIQSEPIQSEPEEDGGKRARKSTPARKAKAGVAVAASPAAANPGISSEIRETAKRLAARYLPPMRGKPDADPRVEDLAEDLAEYGETRVEDALRRAREGDNRGGVSIAFYRAILRGAAASPGAFHRPDSPAPESGYLTRKYTSEDFKAMEIDLDAEET